MGKANGKSRSRKPATNVGACFLLSPLTSRIGIFAAFDADSLCKQLLQTCSDPKLRVLRMEMTLGPRVGEIKAAWNGSHSHREWYVATESLQTWIGTCDMDQLSDASSVMPCTNVDALISMNEQVFLLSESTKYIERSKSAAERYCRAGARNPYTGEQIYLEAITLPGGVGTSVEAYHRFIMAINRRAGMNQTAPQSHKKTATEESE